MSTVLLCTVLAALVVGRSLLSNCFGTSHSQTIDPDDLQLVDQTADAVLASGTLQFGVLQTHAFVHVRHPHDDPALRARLEQVVRARVRRRLWLDSFSRLRRHRPVRLRFRWRTGPRAVRTYGWDDPLPIFDPRRN